MPPAHPDAEVFEVERSTWVPLISTQGAGSVGGASTFALSRKLMPENFCLGGEMKLKRSPLEALTEGVEVDCPTQQGRLVWRPVTPRSVCVVGVSVYSFGTHSCFEDPFAKTGVPWIGRGTISASAFLPPAPERQARRTRRRRRGRRWRSCWR